MKIQEGILKDFVLKQIPRTSNKTLTPLDFLLILLALCNFSASLWSF